MPMASRAAAPSSPGRSARRTGVREPARSTQPWSGELGSTADEPGQRQQRPRPPGRPARAGRGSRRPGADRPGRRPATTAGRTRHTPAVQAAEGQRERAVHDVADEPIVRASAASRAARVAAQAPMPTLTAKASSGTTVTCAAPTVRWAPPASSHRLAPTPSEPVHDTVLSDAATQTSSAGRTNTAAEPAAARAPATRPVGARREPGPLVGRRGPPTQQFHHSHRRRHRRRPARRSPRATPSSRREMSERAATQPRATASAAV